MLIIITALSILGIAGLVWALNRTSLVTVCPICAGVFITWMWQIGAHIWGYQIDLVIPAILMGGSVVGMTYQLEKKFERMSVNAILLWKTTFILFGFAGAYGILEGLWAMFLTALIIIFLLTLWSVSKRRTRTEAPNDLEKKLEHCC